MHVFVSFQVVYADGSPACSQQVILRTLGDVQFGITDQDGFVTIPTCDEEGKIIVLGKTRHYGYLMDLSQVILN
ncbi:MAG: hypothetical protein R3C61_13805 [Bacteroidia bacterium]